MCVCVCVCVCVLFSIFFLSLHINILNEFGNQWAPAVSRVHNAFDDYIQERMKLLI